jgi:hypothetical protein
MFLMDRQLNLLNKCMRWDNTFVPINLLKTMKSLRDFIVDYGFTPDNFIILVECLMSIHMQSGTFYN